MLGKEVDGNSAGSIESRNTLSVVSLRCEQRLDVVKAVSLNAGARAAGKLHHALNALAAIPTGEQKQAWVVLRAVVNDQVLPDHLVDGVRAAVDSLDLVAICRDDVQVAATAAVFAAQHAGRLGAGSVNRVRGQLVEFARECERARLGDEHALQVLLSCPFYLFNEADSDETVAGSRFKRVAELIEEILYEWPATRDQAQYLLDRLVEGLPNDHARNLWGLQVKLRALR